MALTRVLLSCRILRDMKYAIVRYNGKQYKVAAGDVIKVASSDTNDTLNFEVILSADGDNVTVGTPVISGVTIKATVLGDVKGPKIRVAKFRAKSNYHRVIGHRSTYKQVRIDSI